MSTTGSDSGVSLPELSQSEGLDFERIDDFAVALDHNDEQSLFLLESEHVSAAFAIDTAGISLAEAIEVAPNLRSQLELLARGPVFAEGDGGGSE